MDTITEKPSEWKDDRTGLTKYGYWWQIDGKNVVDGSCYGCLISLIDVKSSFRRQGYGTKMLQRLEERVKKNGCLRAYVLAYPSDYPPTIINKDELKEFYRKNGYTQSWWQQIVSSNWMSKELK